MILSYKNNEPYLKSRHIYMNKPAYLYTNTPTNFDVEGKLDCEFPTDWSDDQFSQDLKYHGWRTEESKDRVSIIETHYWCRKNTFSPFISEKLPIYIQRWF